jgi:hypothetical protein
MSDIVIPIYRLKEQSLMDIAKEGWTNYLLNNDYFLSFSPYYTKAFGEQQLTIIDEIQEKFFSVEIEKNGLTHALKSSTINVCRNWQLLKRYVQGAYPKRFHASKLKAAGKLNYFDAYRYNFESLTTLIDDSTIFLIAYKSLLTLDNNMPPTFAEEYFECCDTFKHLHIQYLEVKKMEKENKYEKIKHLNKVYKTLAEMFNDAKRIFIKNKEMQSLFTFRQQIQ